MPKEEEINRIIAETERFFENMRKSFFAEFGKDITLKVDLLTERINELKGDMKVVVTRMEMLDEIRQKVGEHDKDINIIKNDVVLLKEKTKNGEYNNKVFSERSWAIIMVVLSVVITGMVTYHSFVQ